MLFEQILPSKAPISLKLLELQIFDEELTGASPRIYRRSLTERATWKPIPLQSMRGPYRQGRKQLPPEKQQGSTEIRME
jgi:hypothetical protein